MLGNLGGMGDNNDSLSFLLKLHDESHNLLGRYAIQIPCRLIGEEKVGIVYNGSCDGNALLLSSRKFSGSRVYLFIESDAPYEFQCLFFAFPFAAPGIDSGETYVFEDVQTR